MTVKGKNWLSLMAEGCSHRDALYLQPPTRMLFPNLTVLARARARAGTVIGLGVAGAKTFHLPLCRLSTLDDGADEK